MLDLDNLSEEEDEAESEEEHIKGKMKNGGAKNPPQPLPKRNPIKKK